MGEGINAGLNDPALVDLVFWAFGVLMLTAPIVFYVAEDKFKR